MTSLLQSPFPLSSIHEDKVVGSTNKELSTNNNPNEALFEILHRTFTNMKTFDNLLHNNNNNNSNGQELTEQDKGLLSKVTQLCFASIAVTFTTHESPHNVDKKKKSPRKYYPPSLGGEQEYFGLHNGGISEEEWNLLNQSSSQQSQQSHQSHSQQRKLSLQSHKKLMNLSSNSTYTNKRIEDSLIKRPLVPCEIVYELWKELLGINIGVANSNGSNETNEEDPPLIERNEEHKCEITNEERDRLLELFSNKEEQGNDTSVTVTSIKFCDTMKDILVSLGVMESIHVKVDLDLNQLDATVSRAAVDKQSQEEAVGEQKDNEEEESIATGLSNWAGVDDFSLGKSSTTHTHRMGASLFRTKTEYRPTVKVIFDEKKDDDNDRVPLSQKPSVNLFLRINHDITQDYGVHMGIQLFQQQQQQQQQQKKSPNSSGSENGSECDEGTPISLDKKLLVKRWNQMLVTALQVPLQDDVFGMYAVRMLPRHMIQALLLSEVTKILSNDEFVKRRLMWMGLLDGTKRQREDCMCLQSALLLKTLGKKHCNIIESDEVVFPYHNNVNDDIMDEMEWGRRVTIQSLDCLSVCLHEQAKTPELGQAFQMIGSFYGELSQHKAELSHYEFALKLQKDQQQHAFVAEILFAIGSLHQNQGDNYRAMKCYRQLLESLDKQTLGVAYVLQNMGIVYCTLKEFKPALQALEESLRLKRLNLGDNHEEIANSIQWIGKVYRELGQYDLALKHFKAAHYGKEAKFGKQHLEVAECLHNLGIIHDDLGDLEQSLQCYRESIAIRKKMLPDNGNDDEDMLQLLQCIGIVYKGMKKYGKALVCLQECVKLREKQTEKSGSNLSSLLTCYEDLLTLTKLKVGEDHDDVANLYLKCGQLYDKFNMYAKAMDSYEQALRIWRVQINHANIASVLNVMGVVHAKRNVIDKALACFEEALYMRQSKFGPQDLLVATVWHNMGNAHSKAKSFEKAMDCYEKAIEIRKQRGDDIDVARTMHNMGRVCAEINQYDTAMRCYNVTLEIKKNKLGTDHLEVSFTANNQGKIYLKIGKFEEALQCFETTLQIRRKIFGDEDHELIADAISNLATAYVGKGDLDQASKHFETALSMHQSSSSSKPQTMNASVACCLEGKGDIFFHKLDYVNAIASYQEAVSIKTDLVSRGIMEEFDVTGTLFQLGAAYSKHGDFEEALSCFKDVLAIRKKQLGKDHLLVAEVLHEVGSIQCERAQYETAMRCMQETLRIRKKVLLNQNHEAIADTLHVMGHVRHEQQRSKKIRSNQQKQQQEEATNFYNDALDMYKLALHSNHIKVADVMHSLGQHLYHQCQLFQEKEEEGDKQQQQMQQQHQQQPLVEQTLAMFQDSLRIRTLNVGTDDLSFAPTLEQMALVHVHTTRNFDKAKELLQEALRIRHLYPINNHSNDVSETMVHFGLIMIEEGDQPQAIEWFQTIVRTKKETLGEFHLDLIKLLRQLGELHTSMTTTTTTMDGDNNNNIDDHLKDAVSYFEEALTIQKMHLGEDHTETCTCLEQLASLYQKQKDTDKAKRYYEKAILVYKKKGDKKNLHVAHMMNQMGALYAEQLETHEAMKYYKEALKIKKELLGNDHLDLVDTLQRIATIYKSRHDYHHDHHHNNDDDHNHGKTMKTLKEILRIKIHNYGNNNFESASTLVDMGDVFMAKTPQPDPDDAIRCYEAARSIMKQKAGRNTLEIAHILHQMGLALEARQDYPKALQRWQILLGVYHELGLERHDERILRTKKCIEITKRNLLKNEEF